ncbi:MAG: SGNH/GDSL hydrolase family protein [Prolixibacteraceae bacterium]|nr:SGNH/GDSL hydrolase family protein [Prolixibacteraceae bacterium]
MKRKLLSSLVGILIISFFSYSCSNAFSKQVWTGTWGTSPQLTEPHNNPPQPGLTDNALRQTVRVSIGGEVLRLHLSNEFSKSEVKINDIYIALSEGGSSINASTIKSLTFNGSPEVVIQPGQAIVSDQIDFKLNPRTDVSITINFGKTPDDITGHPGSRTTSYILAGNQPESADFSNSITTDHWYIIKGIDVLASDKGGAIAIIGNSITDGRGSGTNKQNRWPDILSERLVANPSTANIGVLNMGVGGNCVLKNCLGPAAVDRFSRDVLERSGVKWVIIFEAVNDLGGTPDSITAMKVVDDLIVAYSSMIEKAHAKNMKVYGATITPFGKSFYYQSYREVARQKLNEWIRTSGKFDALVDFDLTVRDPEDSMTLLPDIHTGDFLHLNEDGYKKMGESVSLDLFK